MSYTSKAQHFPLPTPTITSPLLPLNHNANYADIPIIIDNGTFNYRAGWANSETPHINTRNEVRKSKVGDTTTGRDSYIGVNFSEEILKLPHRTPFDNGLFVNSDIQEEIFDYTFYMLGLSGQTSVTQPIVITEPICNPNYCRNMMTELLMETYGVQSICYVNDGLSSYYYNQTLRNNQLEDGMVINFGNSACTVVPIVNNNVVYNAAKRIDIGGQHITNYMLNILKQRYPEHKSFVTPWLAQYIKEHHMYYPISYLDELARFEILTDGALSHIIQLPIPTKAVKVQPTKEEIEKKQKERQESGKRLKELMQKKRQEKLDRQMEQLQSMEETLTLRSKDKEAFKSEVLALGYDSIKDFDEEYTKVYTAVHKQPPSKNEGNPYPLISIPDDQLTAEQLLEKKQQITLKSMNEGRNKSLLLKKQQKEKKEQKLKEEEERRKNDPEAYIAELYSRRNEILARIEKRKEKPSSSRRNTSSQSRLHLINMASDPKAKDDDFGANDSDWDIYLKMSKGGNEEEEEKEKQELAKLEKLIAKYDPKPNVEIPIEAYYQLYLGVDRIRVPELIFQPSLIGLDQMGLTEVVKTVFSSFPGEQQKLIEKNIIVTGGSAKFVGLEDRLRAEIRSIRPTKSNFQIKIADDPLLDAWKGAKLYSSIERNIIDYSVHKNEYFDRGISTRAHLLGNLPY